MHPFESVFRAVWKRFDLAFQLKTIERIGRPSAKELGDHPWRPFECSSCLSKAYRIARSEFCISGDGGKTIVPMTEEDADFVSQVAFLFLKYKRNKVIYDIDSKLVELLRKTKFKDIPTSYIRIPKGDCCVLNFGAWYAILRYSYNILGINIVTSGSELHGVYSFSLSQNTKLSFVADDLAEKDKEGFFVSEEVTGCKDARGFLSLVLNTLLYILGDKDVVAEVHPGAKKSKFQYRDPVYGVQPTVYTVGKNYRHFIERYEFEYERLNAQSMGGAKAPHLRMAHFHLYWRGKNRDQPVVHLLAEIYVNGYLLKFDSDPDVTTVK